ncbi:hypothetical protein OG21DRAFT_1604805 [Imleria badia]|nr:hypothetical protein OG21DRAFT_1604805 [Imleria badia]
MMRHPAPGPPKSEAMGANGGVLKPNRMLKVLNLSESKLDVQWLMAIAEALKYNLCLETLDLSRNPCSGPALEGLPLKIQSLRTAFTLNAALKRLFLSSTQLTSAGAIALAEFLPESASLLNLDPTVNNIDLALSKGLKANHVMRCLDLNIPSDNDEFTVRVACRGADGPDPGRARREQQPFDFQDAFGQRPPSQRQPECGIGDRNRNGNGTGTHPQCTRRSNLARRRRMNPSWSAFLCCAISSTGGPTRLRRSRPHGLGLKVDGLLGPASAHEDGETTPLTPRLDKGKGRAEPEPEESEKVSPTFMITESEDEVAVQATSPTDRSKSWVEEEGEIFRKGTVLLGPEEMEGECAGEDLRRELLEAMVERSPPRGIIDAFGMDAGIQAGPYDDVPSSPACAPAPAPRPYVSLGGSPSPSPISPTPPRANGAGRAFPLLRVRGLVTVMASSALTLRTGPSPTNAGVDASLDKSRLGL